MPRSMSAIPPKFIPPGSAPGWGVRVAVVSLGGSGSFALASAFVSAEVKLAFPGSTSRPRWNDAAASL